MNQPLVREFTAAGSRVVLGNALLDRLGEFVGQGERAHRAAIITDGNVGPLYAARAQAALTALSPVCVTFAPGEASKTRETWLRVTDELLAHRLGRDSVIVALGGGVVGDLAGFVAATYLRGVPVVQVPTSLVAMIDASIGGKTGVDVPAGKNLVGAFHPPLAVVIDPALLATLPARELRGGLAEALKHGIIADAAYFERIADNDVERDELVARSVEIKTRVVNDDPRESGARKTLNFGHTLGHACEAASNYALSHGEAVAIGMTLEAKLGERLGVTARGTAHTIERALMRVGLPTTTTLDAADLISRTRGDKKVRAGVVEYALPAGIGRFDAWTTAVRDDDVLSILVTG